MYFDKDYIINAAESHLNEDNMHITDIICPLSDGDAHDFYSNGDYWWPNSDTADGLPYIRRDGQSNPNAFTAHRKILQQMKTAAADLAAGYKISGNEKYAAKACSILYEFFIDKKTKMNESLCFAQAIPGICSGRGIGIIDTLHLIDIPYAVEALKASPSMSRELYTGIKKWFADYFLWMHTHEYGLTEMNEFNNHGVCWFAQAAVFARFTDNFSWLEKCRRHFKEVLIPNQMADDGSFPAELARTKPYSYSIFVVDNMCTICHAASSANDNLWDFSLPDGRGIKKGIEFIYPFIADKNKWPYPPDIEHFEAFPAKASFLLFAGIAYNDKRLIGTWSKLKNISADDDEEVIRNVAVKQPILWI